MYKKESEDEVKEDFCPSCLVMPLAFVGTGAMVAGGVVPQRHKKWKRALMITGIITLISLIMMVMYYFFMMKGCNSGTCPL